MQLSWWWVAGPRGMRLCGQSFDPSEIDRPLLQALIDNLICLIAFSLLSQDQRLVPMRAGIGGFYLDRSVDVSRRFFDLIPSEQDLSKIVLRLVKARIEPDSRTKVFFRPA